MILSTVFHELAAILVIAGVSRVLALKLPQPLIIRSIVAGPAQPGRASSCNETRLLSRRQTPLSFLLPL
ncbi:MAG: hypothetical protein VKO65_10095 [Cyanobacteriota bacterium]|nr:hypothetical protein [Cyanobacteriota bacterium]